MEIPKIDKRTYEEIVGEIAELSRSFTPEWNFSSAKPDMGSAAAMAYARLAADTAEKFNRTPEKNLIEFFNKLGASRQCFQPAGGYLCFEVSGNSENVAGESVKAGSTYTAAGTSDVVFTLSNDLYAVNSSLCGAVCADGGHDSIHSLYSHYSDNAEQAQFSTVCRPDDNLQRHVLYIKYGGGAFSGAKTKISFTLDKADGISAENFENAVLRSGIYYSTADGFCRGEELTKKDGCFEFRYAEKFPPAKTELFGQESVWLKITFEGEISAADAARVYIEEISAGSSAFGVQPDGIFDDFSQLAATAAFPFGRTLMPYSSVYFACNGVLDKKGSEVTLEFSSRYSRVPINETEDDNIDWKYVMKRSDLKKPKKYDVFVKNVVWEYFGGAGWVRLFPDDRYGGVFNGKNDGSPVKITFTCPNDIAPVNLPSGQCYAIRARAELVENYLKQYGDYIVPQVYLPSFSYSYNELLRVYTVFTENCLEVCGHSLKNNSAQAARLLPDDGKTLEFAFTAPLDRENIGILFEVEAGSGGKGYEWEYLTKNGWQTLDCRDGTNGLSETGLLVFGENSGFVYKERYGHRGYWIRLRFEKAEYYPDGALVRVFLNSARARNTEQRPEEFFTVTESDRVCRLSQSGVYSAKVYVDELPSASPAEADAMAKSKGSRPVYDENGDLVSLFVLWNEYGGERSYTLDRDSSCVIFGENCPHTANVLVNYITSSGDRGNLPKNTDFTANENAGLISRIYNPVRMTGGAGKETLGDALERCAAELRLNARARSGSDFEAAVKAADRSVLRVKALGGKNARGESAPGTLTIAVLFREQEGFPEKSARLEKLLRGMCSPLMRGGKPEIVKPYTVTCNISVTAFVRSPEAAGRVRTRITERFKEFLDAENGNIDKNGWEIGQLPDKPMIYGYLVGTDEVEGLEDFEFTMLGENNEPLNVSALEALKRTGIAAAAAGSAFITVKVI